MARPTKLLLPLTFTILLAAAFAPPAGAEVTVSFGVFFDGLAPYGAWTNHPRLGMVWSPDVAPGWRPYSDGRWAFAADEGWTWLGDEPWAWAPYHYGNWMFDPVAGWLWVPGYDEWAPAVVDWRVTDDWIGWAPRPLSASWIVGPRLLPVHYTFVERRFFAEPILTRYIVPVGRNVELFASRGRSASSTSIGSSARPAPDRARAAAGPQGAAGAPGRAARRVAGARPRRRRAAGARPPAGEGRQSRPPGRSRPEDRTVGPAPGPRAAGRAAGAEPRRP